MTPEKRRAVSAAAIETARRMTDAAVAGEYASISDIPAANVVKVENNKGTELPDTGGMGTRVFYILGTVLVLGAGIILVSRKRASSK